MQKKFFEILVQTALTVGLIWTILELTPKSALLSLSILYFLPTFWKSKTFFQGGFFRKFCPYVWLVLKSGF